MIPKPLSWRKTVVFFPDDIRERYGRLCNRLEDEGTPFPLSEWEAFKITVKFLLDYESKHPDKPINFVLPYHIRAVDALGNPVWIPCKLDNETNFDNSFELDRDGLAELIALNKALAAIKLHKRKLSDHTRSLIQKHLDIRKQSPDDMKVVTAKKSGGRRRFKHSDEVKEMF